MTLKLLFYNKPLKNGKSHTYKSNCRRIKGNRKKAPHARQFAKGKAIEKNIKRFTSKLKIKNMAQLIDVLNDRVKERNQHFENCPTCQQNQENENAPECKTYFFLNNAVDIHREQIRKISVY